MGITYKEYAWLINPAYLDTTEIGGVKGCPESYGFEKHWCGGCGVMSCNDCWNREISYPVIAEAVEETEIYPIMQTRPGSKFEVCEVDINTNPQLGARILIGGQKFWVNHKCFKYYIDKEGKKVQKEFTKSDMKDGMLCETADGTRMFWIDGNPRGISEYSPCIKDDLTHSRYPIGDIVKVGYPDFEKYNTIEQALNGDFKEVLWERKQEKEISSEEAFSVLKEHYGCDVKIKE